MDRVSKDKNLDHEKVRAKAIGYMGMENSLKNLCWKKGMREI